MIRLCDFLYTFESIFMMPVEKTMADAYLIFWVGGFNEKFTTHMHIYVLAF